MLVESSFSSSIETSLLNVPEYQDPFAAYDWASLAETYQIIHKFPEQSPAPDAMSLDESNHPKLQVSCPEKSAMHKVSEKALASLVYYRKKRNVKPGGTVENNLGNNKKHDDSLDDSIVSVHRHGESTKRKNRFHNCLVYSRKKRRGKSSCNFTGDNTTRGDGLDAAFVSEHDSGETKRRGNTSDNGLDDAFVSEHDCGEIKRRGNKSDNCLVYCRKNGRVKSNSCSFSKHVTGGTKVNGDQVDSSAYSQREQTIKADDTFTGPNPGEIKNSGQSKQLVKSNGSFTGSLIGKTKRSGDRSDTLLVYSRRKQRGKSTGTRVNGFLVYRRKKFKFRGPSRVSSHALELGNDDCNSSDAGVSETDTDDSSSPFRQCKHCDKPGTVENMLICDECEKAYHTSCCGVRLKEVAEIDDWLCPSCLKKKSSKTKIKGRISRERNWRVTVPFVIGVRIGKEFQADVPDWSGPIMSDSSFVGEPLEIDESEYMHDLKKAKKTKKKYSAVNWLQCREEDTNGDICGKWRRAPPSEVQTKDWECYCCVFWDPSRADCAVPQELETSEVLKQLKYMKMLRPRSDAKRRKQGPKARSRSHNKGKC